MSLNIDNIRNWVEDNNLKSKTITNCYQYLKTCFIELKEDFDMHTNIFTNVSSVSDIVNISLRLHSLKIEFTDGHIQPYISVIYEIGNNLSYYENQYDFDGQFIDEYLISPEIMEQSH